MFPSKVFSIFPIPHILLSTSPVNGWNIFSMAVHAQYPKHIGWSLVPCFVSFKLYSPFLMSYFAAWRDYLLSAGWIIIHTMSSEPQSVFKNIFLLVPNKYNTGDDITTSFNYSNIVINFGVQDIVGISTRNWHLQIFLNVFNLISKYGAYLKYKLICLIKEWINLSLYGSFRYLIILNLDCDDVLTSCIILCPTH